MAQRTLQLLVIKYSENKSKTHKPKVKKTANSVKI
jgi:hypothetical protein